jgi:hypothetical protein
MALEKGLISKRLAEFIKSQNEQKVEDPNVAIDKYCEELEDEIFDSIKKQSIKIIIPTGAISVTGANAGGPVLCTNVAPIVIDETVAKIIIT